jgi:hypothetical protein
MRKTSILFDGREIELKSPSSRTKKLIVLKNINDEKIPELIL